MAFCSSAALVTPWHHDPVSTYRHHENETADQSASITTYIAGFWNVLWKYYVWKGSEEAEENDHSGVGEICGVTDVRPTFITVMNA